MIRNKKFNTKREELAGDKRRFSSSSFDEAIVALKQKCKESPVKFDEKVDLVIKTNINTKSESIKTIVKGVKGNDKKKKVGVMITSDDLVKEIQNMENVIILDGDKIKDIITKKEIPFDVCICSISALPKLAPAARVLGPKGCMPNLQNGTLIKDEKQIKSALEEIISGSQISVRNNKDGQILLSLGRLSTENDVLKDTFEKILEAVKSAKPKDFKGIYINGIYLNTTMGLSSYKITNI